MSQDIADYQTIFQQNSRITEPGSARSLIKLLEFFRRAAVLLPIAPGTVPFRKVYYIPGHDDALSVLSNDLTFETPYKAAMQKLDTNRQVSLLGFDAAQDATYQKNLCQVMRAMPLDMAGRMGARADAETQLVLAANPLRLDFMRDLLIPVTLAVTQEFYGVNFSNGDAFLKWTMAILDYVFGPPGAASYKIRAAEAAGKLMDAEIQRNIEDPDISDDTILGRLRNDPALRNLTPTAMNERIQATIAALLVGGMPTITQAGFNIMKVLLSDKRAMAMARDAADQDDERLRRCLGEALRFRPVLPVIFRKCIRVPNTIRGSAASAGQVIGPVDWLGRPIPSGADVGVFAVTANFDPRSVTSPHKFDPDRPFSDSLAFGQGRHWCLGMPIAMAVLVNVFRPVLRRGLISLPNDAAKTTYFLDYFAENLDISIGNKAA